MSRHLPKVADEEVGELKACINDLISVMALPAIWTGGDAPKIVGTLLEILQRMLHLEVAYARLPGPAEGEMIEDVRLAICDSPTLAASEIGKVLEPWRHSGYLDSNLKSLRILGRAEVSVRFSSIGYQAGAGWLAFGSTRSDFPTRNECLILEVAINQAALALQEAARLDEQKLATSRLDLLVNQRTAELKSANAALRRSEAHLTEAQSLSRTGSFTWNLLDGKMEWSAEAYCIWELPPEDEPSFDYILRCIHPDDLVSFRQVFDKSVREALDSEAEFRLQMAGGRIKYVQLVRRAVTDAAGRLVEFTGAIHDVTEMRIAFQEIQDLRDRLLRENVVLREEVTEAGMFGQIIGTAPAFRAVLGHIAKVAPTDSTVLITGETGTGKELIARAIHENSKRTAGAFLKINCAAIPTSLIAAELFGHEKGAFTGAMQRKIGRFELANGGTLFLDEVGELPPETQIMLLRVLQEREFERVGGSEVIRANVRIIAATNRDLAEEMKLKKFRRDLFYRLNVFPIEMPPLRERKDDIQSLTSYFIDLYSKKMEKSISAVSKEALTMLQNYHWPGNIRELQNVIERSLILCDCDVLTIDKSWLALDSAVSVVIGRRPPDEESRVIEKVLEETRGRISGPEGAAVKLGMPASTLESRIRALKLNKHRFKSS